MEALVIKKKTIYILILPVLLLLALKVLQSTPFESVMFVGQAGVILYFSLYMTASLLRTVIVKKSIIKIDLYYFLLMLGVPLVSATAALINFNQPFYYGVLTERSWLLIGFTYWLKQELLQKALSFYQLEKLFVMLAWVSFFLLSGIYLISFQSGINQDLGFVYETADRGIRLQFQYFFITFGSLYYFISFQMKKSAMNFISLCLFLAFVLIVIKGRVYILGMLFVFMIFKIEKS